MSHPRDGGPSDKVLAWAREKASGSPGSSLLLTTQEEGGMHGALALGNAERFDRAIGLEVGLVGDLPGVNEGDHPGKLGAGPMIVHKDGVVTYARALSRLIHAAGVRCGTTTQDVAFAHYGSDGMGFIDTGSPAALVAVPTRYTHTGLQMVDIRDIQASIDLLVAVVSGSNGHTLPCAERGPHVASTTICAFNCLCAVGAVVDIESVERVIKIFGMVNVAPGFTATSSVTNGATDLLNYVFGPEKTHCRSAVGMTLPADWAVEVEMIVQPHG